jgi:vancomycin resistance protein YoaR
MYNSIDNNLKVLHPWDEISFHSLFGKNDDGKKFKNWKALVWGKEVDVYGWWVCGAATWLFQWSLFNKDLELKTRWHSSWHDFLYLANINWEKIKVPGLDSTYYDKGLDLKIKNKGNFPIVLINRTKNNVEENFTITLKDNQRISELKFLNQNWKCYTWKRWNETIKNCYREVKK